jgi:chromosome segregation ATPase
LMAQCRVLADQLKTAKVETAQLRKDLALAVKNATETKVNAESASSAKQKLEYELGQAARELQSMEFDLERSMKRVNDLNADNKELRRVVRQQEESLRELHAVNADKTTQIANLESKVSLLLENSAKEENPSKLDAQPPTVEDKPAVSQDKALGELHKELENKNRRVMCLIEELEKERRRVAELQRQVWDQAIEIDELHGERRKNFGTEAEVVRLRGKVEYLEEALSHARKGVMTAQVGSATERKEGRLKEQSDVFDDVFELYSGTSIARNGGRRGAEETWLMDVNEA